MMTIYQEQMKPGKFFHPKEEGGVGYILTISGTKLYYAGDSDQIQEMNNIKTQRRSAQMGDGEPPRQSARQAPVLRWHI